MTRSGIPRRRLITSLGTSLGAGALGARLLPFLPHDALAAGTAPKRLLVVFSPLGYLESSFWPTPAGDGWNLGETMTALAPWKDKLIYVDGLRVSAKGNGNEHDNGMGCVFTATTKYGLAAGPSIDQVVAKHLHAQEKLAYPYIGLGVSVPEPNGFNSCFYSGASAPLAPEDNPKAAFDSIFKNVMTTAGTVDTTAAARLQRQEKSVIDVVKADLDRVCKRMGREAKDKCAAHLAGLEGLERRLGMAAAPQISGCTKPAVPGSGLSQLGTAKANIDIIAGALSCNLTRVAMLQLGHCNGSYSPVPGINHHNTSHWIGDRKGDPAVIADHKKIDRALADLWAYLFTKLESYKEGNGSLLDNTLVLFGSETTTGQTLATGAHQHWRFPLWMAGGGNFAFKTGRHIKLPPPAGSDPKAQVPHNRLLVSVARAFGMDIDKFGMDPGSGPLAQL